MKEDMIINVWQKVLGLLQKTRPPPSNITPEERKALKELKRDDRLSILPAYKGRATVLMDKATYEQKMQLLLSDTDTYKVV